MPAIEKIEFEKRIRVVQEWILDDWHSSDIITQIALKWAIAERQAKRYLAEARKRWVADDTVLIAHKRRLKIEGLKKLKRSLKDPYKGTPEGIKAVLAIEKEIISLEGMAPAIKVENTQMGADGRPVNPSNNFILTLPPGVNINLPSNTEGLEED